MIKKIKKMTLTLGAVSSIVIPVVATVSCGDETDNNTNGGIDNNTNGGIDNNTTGGDNTNAGGNVDSGSVSKGGSLANSADDWTPFDRSGKVLSVSKNVNWKVEAGGHSEVVVADVYHTSIFDYVAEHGTTFGGVPFDQTIVEGLAKIFEKNTIIGSGHYSDEFIGRNKGITKNFPIQFLKSNDAASYGGLIGVMMNSSSTVDPTKSSAKFTPDTYLSTAELMMHEYGHHEIMYGSYISMDETEKAKLIAQHNDVNYWPMYETLIKAMKDDPLLKPYTKYFEVKGPHVSAAQTNIPKEWVSPWGKVPQGAQAWDPSIYGYVLNPAEFLTRLMSEMEGTIDPLHFLDPYTGLIDTLDANAMYLGYGSHPLGTKESLTHFINLYKKYIFGLDSNTLVGVSVLAKKGFGIMLTDPKATPKGEITYNFDLKAYAGWSMGQLDAAKNGFTPEEAEVIKKFFNNGSDSKKTVTLKFDSSSFVKHQVEFGLNSSIENGKYTREETTANYFTLKEVPSFEQKLLGQSLAKFVNFLAIYPDAAAKIDLRISK